MNCSYCCDRCILVFAAPQQFKGQCANWAGPMPEPVCHDMHHNATWARHDRV